MTNHSDDTNGFATIFDGNNFNDWQIAGQHYDCIKIGRMAKSLQDVNFIMDAFMKCPL